MANPPIRLPPLLITVAPRKLRTRITDKYLISFRAKSPLDATWGEEKYALINPTSLKEQISAHYSLRPVLGLSHEVVQYIRTGTRRITMELWLSYHVLMAKQPEKEPDPGLLLEWRNYFESLLVPVASGQSPPIVAVCWPNANLAFKGVLDSISTEYERFGCYGAPIEFKMDLAFIEICDALMTSDKVATCGLGLSSYASWNTKTL